MKALAGYRLIRDPAIELAWDKRSKLKVLDDGAAVHRLMRPLARVEETEVIWSLPVNTELELITPGPIVVARGSNRNCDVTVGACFRIAVAADAYGLILVHNHPVGSSKPSARDTLWTARLIQAGAILDIKFLDHVIVAGDGYYSFREAGDLDVEGE